MVFDLPKTYSEFSGWEWPQFEPYANDLLARTLTAATLQAWLGDWSSLAACIDEMYNRLYVATTVDTTDKTVAERYQYFMDEIFPAAEEANQKIKEKLLASGLTLKGYEIPLRNLRSEAELFRKENLPLLSEEQKLNSSYDRIIGAQTVVWQGEERTLTQIHPVLQGPDRAEREQAWRLTAERQIKDRAAINEVWKTLLALRLQLAANAGMPSYRDFRWKQLQRFDYTPSDCRRFQDAIEKVAVPAAARIYERRRQRLGVETLRPWDLDVDPLGRPALRPFEDVSELKARTSAIFHRVDPQFGEYFDTMAREGLLDLENRKGKAPGGYCTGFSRTKRPFIFMNAVGMHDDAQTLLHEGGHSFHAFEAYRLPYIQQMNVPMEFAEVASMGMELLASPYLATSEGGYYSPVDAARARIEHLEGALTFWPYMAVVDAFQHWVYENPVKAAAPEECDATWGQLWTRFRPDVDWSGFEDARVTGWQRKLHIFEVPFYYVEYGLAQLGAFQVWRNALRDQAGSVADYRRALSLGGTATLPALFQAAGGRLGFDASILKMAVALGEEMIERLEEVK